jgi:D-sedoheptulose 7-phosphate isomerase
VIRKSQAYFETVANVLPHLPFDLLDRVSLLLFEAYVEGRTIFLFGNGGSASLASHMACDLGKGTIQPDNPKRVRVLSLVDNLPTITAWANDSSYDDIFAEQLRNLARPGDIALAISGSGNSRNVLKGLLVARELQLTTIGIGGMGGGKMKRLCDIGVVVPSDNMQIIEDFHVCIAHCLFTTLRQRIAEQPEGRAIATTVAMGATPNAPAPQ